jgi:hypothetical protein
MIAVGGVEGKLVQFDPSAKLVTGETSAHNTDIIEIYFYDEHLQILTVAQDRTIMVWDSNRLECIQSIKDKVPQGRPLISSCFNQRK